MAMTSSNNPDNPAASIEEWDDWGDAVEGTEAITKQADKRADKQEDWGEIAHQTQAGRPEESVGPLMMVETAFLASTAALLWLINFYFPLGPVFRICFPIPIALVYLRWNLRAAWMAAGVASLLLSILMGPVRSLFFLVPSGLLGVLLGFCWRRGANWGVSIGLGSIVNSIGFFFRVGLTSVLLGEDLWVYATTQVTRLLDWVAVRFNQIYQPELATVQALAVVLVLLQSVLYLFIVHLVAWYILDRLGAKLPAPPRWVQVMLELDAE
jgi:uncharacterized protein YybS (DUF2232 family)